MNRGVAAGLAVGLVAAAIYGGWRATRPPPPNPLDSWKGPSADPHENKLRRLTFDEGATARLRVPLGWSRDRREAVVVLLPLDGESGAAAAARLPALMSGPWLLLVPEGPPDRAFVDVAVARVHAEYRTDPDRVLVIGEENGAAVAAAAGCAGGDAVVVQPEGPCGVGGTAWAWVARGGRWEPVEAPPDEASWLAEQVRQWQSR